jgi:hypothetical protein
LCQTGYNKSAECYNERARKQHVEGMEAGDAPDTAHQYFKQTCDTTPILTISKLYRQVQHHSFTLLLAFCFSVHHGITTIACA